MVETVTANCNYVQSDVEPYLCMIGIKVRFYGHSRIPELYSFRTGDQRLQVSCLCVYSCRIYLFQPFICDCSFSHRNKQEPEQINVQIKTKAMEYKGTTKKESDFDQYWSIHFLVLF